MKYNKIKVITNLKYKVYFTKDNCLYYDMYESDFAKFRLSLKLSGEVEFKIFLFEELCEKTICNL
jgi:hypothetical protein